MDNINCSTHEAINSFTCLLHERVVHIGNWLDTSTVWMYVCTFSPVVYRCPDILFVLFTSRLPLTRRKCGHTFANRKKRIQLSRHRSRLFLDLASREIVSEDFEMFTSWKLLQFERRKKKKKKRSRARSRNEKSREENASWKRERGQRFCGNRCVYRSRVSPRSIYHSLLISYFARA